MQGLLLCFLFFFSQLIKRGPGFVEGDHVTLTHLGGEGGCPALKDSVKNFLDGSDPEPCHIFLKLI